MAAEDKNDYLNLPAVKSTRVLRSILMDVVNTGESLVAIGERGYIAVSKDKGNSWIQSTVPNSVTLTAVDFPTARQGWAVGHQAVVLHTSDGGKTWEKQIDGFEVNKLMLADVKRMTEIKKSQVEAAEGELKENLEEEITNLIFMNDDWAVQVEEGASTPFMDVCFLNENKGFVVGAFGMIFKTEDGGKTWVPMVVQIPNSYGYHYFGIARSDKWLFIAGESGMIFRSSDEGENWERLESPYEGTFFGVDCSPDGSLVVIYGLRGNVFRSTDGGQTWQQSELATKITVLGGKIFDDGSVWLVTANGALFRSADSAASFTEVKSDKSAYPALLEADTGVVMSPKVNLPKMPPAAIAIEDAGEGNIIVCGLLGLTIVSPDAMVTGDK